MPKIDIAWQSYTTQSKQLINQECINAYVEPSPPGAKTQMPVSAIPGTSLYSRLGTSRGPIYGLHVMQGDLYSVSGGSLYVTRQTDALATPDGQAVPSTYLGETVVGAVCSMADNGQQLVMVDGEGGTIYQPGGLNQVTTATAATGATSVACNITGTITSGDTLTLPLDNGATFTTTASATSTYLDTIISWTDPLPSQMTSGAVILDGNNTIARITAAAFMPAATVAYFDGYFVFDARGTRQFFLSAINDGTQYSGLDFATATASSSDVVGVAVYHEQLLIFTETNIEVWWDAGNSSFPFQRYDAALVQRGCASAMSICQEDNTIFWMGDDGSFYRLEGFLPVRISSFAAEYAWSTYPNKFRDCTAYVLDQRGHKFIVVNFPSGCACWVYDIASKLWHTRQSYGTPWV